MVLAIMTKRNSRNPMAFAVEKVAVAGNTICMTYSGQNALGDYTGEQALIDKNTNELWYSAQDGFIARNIKCPSHFFGRHIIEEYYRRGKRDPLCHNFARTICANVSQSANRAAAQRLQTLGFIQVTIH
jgi:hypothetical protein